MIGLVADSAQRFTIVTELLKNNAKRSVYRRKVCERIPADFAGPAFLSLAWSFEHHQPRK